MAQVPNVPLPNVAPSAQPTPTQQLDAPAQAFGANVGAQVANDLSEAQGKVSANLAEYANTVQTLVNKSTADQGTQAYTDYADQKVAQFKEQNPGLLAQQNLPALLDDLNTKRAELHGSMSPLAASMYDQESRRIQSYATSSASQFAVSATHKYNLDSADGTIKMNQQLMASHPTDLQALAQDYQSIAQAVHAKAVLNGTPDNLAVWETATAVSAGARQAISGLSNSNPIQAADLKKVYEDHGFLTPTDSDYLDKVLRAPLTAQGAAHIANAGMDAVLAAHPTVNGVPVGGPTNNPTNLQPLPNGHQWPGQTGVSGRFATFATPQAGVEAAVQNLQAYGSQHGINTLQGIANRWAPAGDGDNNPQAYAAALGKSLGIDPNAPLNMKDPALLHRIVQAQIPLETGRSGGSPVNRIEAQLPALLDNARTQAQAFAAKYGLDPDEVEQSVVQKTVANYDKYKLAYAQQNTADQASILATIEKGGANGEPLDSKDDLFKVPGMAEAYARLTPTQQKSLDANLYSNANQVTSARLDAHGQVRAMAALPDQQSSFLAQDFTDKSKWDLTRSDQIWALNEQARLRGEKVKTANEESTIQTIMKSPQFVSTLKQADITPTDPEYLKVAGAVQGELESWAANPANANKKPSAKDINAMAQKVFTNFAAAPKKSFFGLFTSTPGPEYAEVPDADRQFILSEQARRYPGVALNEQDISRLYHLGVRAPTNGH